MSTSRLSLLLSKWAVSRVNDEGCAYATTNHTLESKRDQLHDLRKEICNHRRALYGTSIPDKCYGCTFSAIPRDPFPMKILVGELSHALKTFKHRKNMETST
jgi:hypothetical protein